MGETNNLDFHDFGTFERVLGSQSQFLNLKTLEIQNLDFFRNNGRRQILKICLIRSWRSWIWDQYQSKSMQCTYGSMGSLNLWTFETLNFQVWNQYTLKAINFETKKPRNFATKNQDTLKLWNQDTNKPRNQQTRNQETNKLFQLRESPALLNIPTLPLHPHMIFLWLNCHA